jgi:RNA polymerase sigma-54 factor
MLKQSLQQKLQQKLSPQQIQMIRLLEIPALEMEERIKQEIEENPVLEEAPEDDFEDKLPENDVLNSGDNEDFTLGDYRNEDNIPDYKLTTNNYSDEDRKEGIPLSSTSSLHEYLIEQLHLKSLSEKEMELAEYVIGNIDQDGYLRREEEAMIDDYSFLSGDMVGEEAMKNAVKIVQEFEPAGVGATSLQECLALQLKRKEQTPDIQLATEIIENSFEDFIRKHYDKILKRYSVSEEQFKRAMSEIVKLNPKPGSAWESVLEENSVQLIPDFILENDNGNLILSLNNRNIPELRINKEYAEMLEEYSINKENQSREMKDAVLFVKQKLDSAKWFINAIKQRQETLQNTMNAIVKRQKDFFLEGDETKLKPMILKDISDDTGYDISTISRVSNSKYIQTDFGVYSLKFFFSESMRNDQGEEISAIEIKTILEESIRSEDKRSPLTDDKLTEILQEKGYVIARRTVAKYREQLHFPVARLRKEI